MATKTPHPGSAKAGADMKNIYKTPHKHSDRNRASSEFPEFEVKIGKVSSMILLLESQEVEVVQKALHHIDTFGSIGIQQLQELCDEKVFKSVAKNLYKSDDLITKRFAFKLLVQFTSNISDCKKQLSHFDALLTEAKEIFTTSPDDILVEFASILLRHICDDPKHVDSLGRDEAFLLNIFDKFKSHDEDILLHSIQLLNVVMRNSMLIESIVELKDFPFKNLQIEMKNDITEIRIAAVEGLVLITDCNVNPFWELLGSERFIEGIFDVCEKEDDETLQRLGLKVFKNLCKNQKILISLSSSGYVIKFLEKFNNKTGKNRESILEILTHFATLDDNRKVLCGNGIIKDILEMLQVNGSEKACEALITMSANIFCLNEILRENIYTILINIAMDDEKKWSNRTLALTAFNKLINIQGLNRLIEICDDIGQKFPEMFSHSSQLSFSSIAISILLKLGEYQVIKEQLAATNLPDEIFTAIDSFNHSTRVEVQLFNLASTFIDQESFRKSFIDHCGTNFINSSLRSPSSVLRAAVCNFINAAANFPTLCEIFIKTGTLKLVLENFDCEMGSDAFETILNHDLSMKFAVRRCLEVKDKITSGFYASKENRKNFQDFYDAMSREALSPIKPVYTINFEESGRDVKIGQRGVLHDKNLIHLLSEIKDDSSFQCGDIHDKISFIGRKVSKFLQNSDECFSHQLHLHITELKFKHATTVIPIGSLVLGNSFEAAVLFKALADQLEVPTSLHVDESGKGWNQVCIGTNVVDLFFNIGELYAASSLEARKYFQRIL